MPSKPYNWDNEKFVASLVVLAYLGRSNRRLRATERTVDATATPPIDSADKSDSSKEAGARSYLLFYICLRWFRGG